MQSTASLQHSGESHAALEQIHYYLDGIEEGQGPSRSMSALQLAEVCALKSPGPPHLASPIPTMSTNGRLLLRAKGGLAQCMDLVERLKVEHAAHAYEHIYCMMTLLYFVTLDSENCKSLTSDVLSKVLQVLELTSDTPWKYNHATVVVVTRDGDASNKRALLRKKSSTRRLGDAKRGVSLVAQAETLLRSDDMFRSTDVMPIVTLTDVVLGVLNNAFHTDQKNEYGNSNNKTIHSTPCASKSLATAALLHDRKMLLRDCGGLDTIARIIDVASAASVVERGAASHLFHSMRLLEQASFLERGIQDHLVLHTNVLSVLLRILSSSRHDTRELTLMALRVLINLTHKNDIASTHIAAAHGTHALLALFLHASSSTSSQETEEPSMLDNDKAGFDMCLLALGALINCVEHNETNRDDVARYNDSILDMLTAYFVTRVSTFEHILLRPNADVIATWHPEDVILSGSMAMLLGCIMRKRSSNAHRILAALPDQSPHLLLRVLVAFVGLHAQIGALSEEILESCIDVETELKALMDHGEGQTENTPSLTLTFKADDIRKSMANFGIPVALTKKNPSPQEGYNSQLSIDAPVEFTTPKYPSTFRGGNTPPASAFHFSGGFSNVSTPDSAESSARRTTPKVALRKRTSRTLGVYTPQDSVDSKRAKGAAFIWADETASDDGTNGSSAAMSSSIKRKAKSPLSSNGRSTPTVLKGWQPAPSPTTDGATRATFKSSVQPTFSRKKAAQPNPNGSYTPATRPVDPRAVAKTDEYMNSAVGRPSFSMRHTTQQHLLTAPTLANVSSTSRPTSAPVAIKSTAEQSGLDDLCTPPNSAAVLTRATMRKQPRRLDIAQPSEDVVGQPHEQARATSAGAKRTRSPPAANHNLAKLPLSMDGRSNSKPAAQYSTNQTIRTSVRKLPSKSNPAPCEGAVSSQPTTPSQTKNTLDVVKNAPLSKAPVESNTARFVKSALSKKTAFKSSSTASHTAKKQLEDAFRFDG